MLFSKQHIKKLEDSDYIKLVKTMIDAGGNVSAVDNRGMNCVMLAVGGGNRRFVKWAYDHARPLAENGFNWNQRNDDNRNALCLTSNGYHVHLAIKKMMNSLADSGFIERIQHASVPGCPERTGGFSGVHQRARSSTCNDDSLGKDWNFY
jgi:hypothetical protein